jgi:hypothetical protein
MDGNSFIDAFSGMRPEQCNDHAFTASTPVVSLYTEAKAACDRLRSLLLFLNPDSQYSPESADIGPEQICSLQSRLKEASVLFETLSRESPFLSIPESDGLLPSLPPRALLEACLETYFTCLSPILPIYDRQSVASAIEEQYGPTINNPDPAWVISFSNILLQTLDAKYTAVTRGVSFSHNELEEELIKSLVLNCRRGYNNFERLLRP